MNRSALSNPQRRVRATERLIHKALAIGVFQNRHETLSVIPLALIETKDLLVNVGVKVEGTRGDVGSVKRPLQARPKVFNRVRMHNSFAIRHEMVNEGVLVVAEATVREKRVGVDRRAWKDVLPNMGFQFRPLAASDNHRPHPALAASVTLRDSEHRRLAFGRPVLHLLEAKARRHRRLLATADEGFVRFHNAVKHTGFGRSHGFTNAMQHEPRGLLRHAEGAPQLMRGRSVLRVGEKPNGGKPLGEREWGRLENRVDLDRELPLTILAAPLLAGGDQLDRRGATTHARAGHAMRPAALNGIGPSDLRVGEKGNGFKEGGRRLVHETSIYSLSANWVAFSGASGISS